MEQYNKKNKIAVAISGGVDSSTVAYLLKKEGYDIFGVTMKTYKDIDEDAEKVCKELGIPHYIYDATASFKEKVIEPFVKNYTEGLTPNPCLVCNRYIKFDTLLEFAQSKGADFMATGHYARIEDGTLCVGKDTQKDQVYFLAGIKKENLKKIIFPIGKLEKNEVRKLAEELGIRTYAKKDSQEICFVDDGKLTEFLIEKSKDKINVKGKIVDTNGKFLGFHKGIEFYTIGQRKGLGISSEAPLYVVKLDAKNNQIILGTNEELFTDKIIAKNFNLLYLNDWKQLEEKNYYIKVRSRDSLHLCKIKIIEEEKFEVQVLNDKVRAVTPGQGIVIYDEDSKIIASGIIVNE